MKLNNLLVYLRKVHLRWWLIGGASLLLILGLLVGNALHGDKVVVDDTPRGLILSQPVVGNGLTVLDLKAYGAVGDGVTDDRVAITNAITAGGALGASTIYVPPGTYILSRNGSNTYSLDVPNGNFTLQGVHGKSWFKHPTGMPNASVALVRIDAKTNITIRDMGFDGNWQNAATFITNSSNDLALPQATINVADASDFPSGTFAAVLTSTAGPQNITCTGKTATTFTGCSGGTGSMYVGQRVGYVDAGAGINHATQSVHKTTIASGSNGQTLPQATINVADTTSFDTFTSGDTLVVQTSLGYQHITCTGITPTTAFTGCTGGVGTLSTGNEIMQGADPQNYLVMLRGTTNVTIENSLFKRAYGDCIWLGRSSAGGIGTEARNTKILNTDCDMSARSGIAPAGGVDGLQVDHVRLTNIQGQAFDDEPVAYYVRDVTVSNSLLDGWFTNDTSGHSPVAIAGARINNVATQASSMRKVRLFNNTINGSIFLERATDVVIRNNRILNDSSFSNKSAIYMEFSIEDVTLDGNYIYDRAPAGPTDNSGTTAGIQIVASGTVPHQYEPSTVKIINNHIHVRNGRWGISLMSAGGLAHSTTGTATSVSSTTMANSGAAWTVNEWTGHYVRIGTAVAGISSNTSTTLTLEPATLDTTSAWTTPLGEPTTTPSTGTYVILRNTGVVDVDSNYIDGTNDGNGKGKGIRLTSGSNNAPGLRVRVRRNVLRNIDTDGISLKFDGTATYPYVEITDNFGHDDQPTPTFTNLIKITNAIRTTKFVMRGNTIGEGVTNMTSGLSSGVWLISDGIVQDWAGFGTPESVVSAPVSSTFSRLDGSGTTASYVKGSGTGNTGWLPAGGAITGVTGGNGITISGTQALTASITGLAAASNNAVITADGAGGSTWKTTATLTGLSTTGHQDAKGTSPALTSCGTGPSIVGDDTAGTVTEGATATGCVITFASAYTAVPSCVVISEAGLGFSTVILTTSITITNVGALSGTKIDYTCYGH